MVSDKHAPNLVRNILASLANRIHLIRAALFSRDRHLPPRERIVEKQLSVIGWANFFELVRDDLAWHEPLSQFQELVRNGPENPQSCEADVGLLLYNLVRLLKAKHIVEVGVYRGAGSMHLSLGLHENGGGTIYLVDISQESLTAVETRIKNAGLNVETRLFCCDSTIAAKQMDLSTADLIFLDADHQYEIVLEDIQNYLCLLKDRGILVVHDTIMWGAARAASEMFQQGQRVFTLASSGGSGVSIICRII